MSIRYGQFCPIAKAAEVLGERWTILIVRELLVGTTRFNDFQRALSRISPTLLTKRLVQLQDAGLVVKKGARDQRRSDYFLTAAGRELGPVIMGLGAWGARWARGRMDDDELDVELLMADLRRRIDGEQLPNGTTVLQFTFKGLSEFSNWWIAIEQGGQRELCVDHPGHEVDLHLISDVRTMAEIWAGDRTLREARESGQLTLSGSPLLIRTLSKWLRPGLLAHVRPAEHPDAEAAR